ncbi:hypothetical protein [Streptomyces cucumeris]|uniref:hypothetical protein n=1 Tax=Streptomyces cucumeris TaxID=2962890 RepID=UPI003D762361
MDGITGGTVLALLGVFLGTVGTLIGQHLTTRVEVQRDHRQRADTERAERKDAILGFLTAAQRVELILDRRKLGLPSPDDPDDEKLHDLWLAQKSVELVCSWEVARLAHEFTTVLHTLIRTSPSDGRGAGKRERRHAFMEAARGELEGGRPHVRR